MNWDQIMPFEGIGDFKLYMSVEDAKRILKENKAQFTMEVWDNKGCTPEVPWTIIRVNKNMHMFFAKDKLWKIYCDEDFSGRLFNGIYIGMPFDEAMKIDNTLVFDDWEEDWASEQGYWLEDNLDEKTVMSICIFIKELLDEDEFDRYEW